MYLRREGKRGHEEVLLFIDWEDVSEEDIKLMASHYVVNRAAFDMKGYDHILPESVEYRAADFVHTEPLVKLELAIPDAWKGKDSKAREKFLEAVEELTPEEIMLLLRE